MPEPVSATAQVDAVLASLPADQRAALQHLRETIATAAPDAVEAISYGAPAFRYRQRPLVAYNAYKAHCSFFPMDPALIERYRDQLAGTSIAAKGTLRFTPDHPIPDPLIGSIVRERMAAIDRR